MQLRTRGVDYTVRCMRTGCLTVDIMIADLDAADSPVAHDLLEVGDEGICEASEDLVQVLVLLDAAPRQRDAERAAQAQVRADALLLLPLPHLVVHVHRGSLPVRLAPVHLCQCQLEWFARRHWLQEFLVSTLRVLVTLLFPTLFRARQSLLAARFEFGQAITMIAPNSQVSSRLGGLNT